MADRIELRCETCQATFTRPGARGPLPRYCLDCRAQRDRDKTNAWHKTNAGRLARSERVRRQSPEVKARRARLARERRANDPDYAAAVTKRDRCAKYGITEEQFDEMVKTQGGRCPLCGTTEPGGRHGVWHIDHDHETGKVRDLLCNDCNLGIGFLGDDPDVLIRAAAYLQRHRS